MKIRGSVVRPISVTEHEVLDDVVISIGPRGTIESVEAAGTVPVDLDVRPGIITPGFVDAHLHYPQTRVVGSATGPLLQWLARSVFPEESRFADDAHAASVARTYVDRMLGQGTTTSLTYGSVHASAADLLFAEADRAGVRMIAGPVLMERDAPAGLCVGWEQARDGLDGLRERWHGHDGRLALAVLPRFALSCTEATLRGAAAYAQQHDLLVSTHIAETPDEYAATCARFSAETYLEIYDRCGLVHDRLVLAHCLHLTDSEQDRIAAAGSVVAHCPDSNDFLGSGSMPLAQLDARGIRIAIGTDVAAGRTFSIPRTLAAAYDNALRVGGDLNLSRLVWWGTAGGAEALGLEAGLGRIEPGAPADLVVHRVPPWVGSDGALASILFEADAPTVERVFVRGRAVWPRED